jgi:DNA helicase II / ATP-dependent DNA helicase PcrA
VGRSALQRASPSAGVTVDVVPSLPSQRELELLSALDETQAAAVAHPNGPLLVVAGPGSGKTRVLTHRVAVMLARGVAPWRILAVTFTNKAAAEMRERLAAMVDPDVARQLWVCTVHAACVRILRAEHDVLGLRRDFAIADASDTERLLYRVVGDLNVVADAADRKAYARSARGAISSARNRRQSIMRAGVRVGLDRLVEVEAEYRSRLRATNTLDFDDLLVLTHHLLTENAEVRSRWAERWAAVLQDEAQDQNVLQSEIVAACASVHRNVTYVGDLDQSIYAFRGAEPEELARFTEQWPDGEVVRLGVNYRSTPQIVELAGQVIAANPAQHRAVQRPAAGAGTPVLLRTCYSDRDEARWVASTVAEVGGPLSEFAVLLRTNAQTRVLEEAFLGARLPYQLVGDVRFYDRAEVRDALAWLRLAVNPADWLAFERASSAPRRGVGPGALASVSGEAGPGGDLVLAAARLGVSGGRGAAALAEFADDIAAVVAAADGGPADALRVVLAGGLTEHWAKADNGESRLENLAELVAAAQDFMSSGRDVEGSPVAEMDGRGALVAFLEHAALVASSDDVDVDAVRVMTIHAAKGREFDNVFVVGLEEELLPHALSTGSAADVREERRLLFVAVTRARKRLWLSHALQRFRFGRVVDSTPSRFLSDLPTSVIRSGGAPRPAASPPSWGTQTRRSGRSSYVQRPSRPPARRPAAGTSGGTLGLTPKPVKPSGPRLAADEVAVGVRVHHEVFGSGVVSEAGGDVVRVSFDDGKQRTLDVKVAPLRRAG